MRLAYWRFYKKYKPQHKLEKFYSLRSKLLNAVG
jgi:hypothetical protein